MTWRIHRDLYWNANTDMIYCDTTGYRRDQNHPSSKKTCKAEYFSMNNRARHLSGYLCKLLFRQSSRHRDSISRISSSRSSSYPRRITSSSDDISRIGSQSYGQEKCSDEETSFCRDTVISNYYLF